MIYKVIALPAYDVLFTGLTIWEATARMQEYNASVPPSQSSRHAVIAECSEVSSRRPTPEATQRADEILERAAAGYSAAGNNNVPEWQRSQRGW